MHILSRLRFFLRYPIPTIHQLEVGETVHKEGPEMGCEIKSLNPEFDFIIRPYPPPFS